MLAALQPARHPLRADRKPALCLRSCRAQRTLAAACETARGSTGGKPSAATFMTPLWPSSPSATTMQFSAGTTPFQSAMLGMAAKCEQHNGECRIQVKRLSTPTSHMQKGRF